jgi:hypothetical protein
MVLALLIKCPIEGLYTFQIVKYRTERKDLPVYQIQAKKQSHSDDGFCLKGNVECRETLISRAEDQWIIFSRHS